MQFMYCIQCTAYTGICVYLLQYTDI